MNEEFFRMVELSYQGFYCSQILIMDALENLNKSNEDLVRAMAGLAGGIGFSGKNCGSLTGGACVLALYAGKGSPQEKEDPRLNLMISELVQWFEEEWGKTYGSIDCQDILEDNPQNRLQRCPQIIFQTNEKIKEILTANGYNLSGELEE
ncbi:MAG: C_GCAxxG_C_C family protein [Clostridia bacterium]|nr:C_GCAxxG_C_C family protein [Clostridia bacterium]